MFIVHRQVAGLPNLEIIIHYSSLHYYEPPKKDILFINTVSKNKEGFIKREIKISVKAWELQHTLGFTTIKEVNWIIRSNQIQDCPVDAEDVDSTKTICGKTCSI